MAAIMPGRPLSPATLPSSVVPDASQIDRPLDEEFIERHSIIERYLKGNLPLKARQQFEKYCREHPEMLVAIGLPDQINAAQSLLEAAGNPVSAKLRMPEFWQRPGAFFAVASLAVVMMALGLWLYTALNNARGQINALQADVHTRPMLAAESARAVLVTPSREGLPATPSASIGGSDAEMAELRVDLSKSRYNNFRVTIDRVEQGRLLVLSNQQRDSNGHLRMALNSSALGPGNYEVTLQGLDWSGATHNEAYFTFDVRR